MASTPTFQSNPYADFDPSQWSNPYSNFQNSAIPFPATYSGWPTDASGNPIQPTPGMTLNSAPAQAAAPQAAARQSGQDPFAGSVLSSGNSAVDMANWGGFMGPQNAMDRAYGSWGPGAQASPQAAPAAAAPAAASTPLQVGNPLTSQQYLQLRANPGRVTTPGATVPQSASSATPGPGMLQSFLANWNPATSGPGSGFQQAFSKALKGS